MNTDTRKLDIPKSSYIETNGINLHVMRVGHEGGEPVLMLHGFPEFWYGWQAQIPALVEAGYHLIIPDQRGYNLSDKPDGVEAYRIENLVADVIGLIDALGYDKVRLVAHDWGAVVAWNAAMWHPDRLEQLVIMNVPHPHVYMKFIRSDIRQMLRSWYIGFFQIPGLPEQVAKVNDWQAFGDFLQRDAELSEEQMRRYKQAWNQPKAMTSMMNWYRALARYRPQARTDGRIHVPTMMLWGAKDVALSVDMTEPSIEMCDEGKLVIFKGASHFVQHVRAQRVNEMLVDFFANGVTDEPPSRSERLQ